MATKKKKDKTVVAFQSEAGKRLYYYRIKKTLTELTSLRKYCKFTRKHVVCTKTKA